VKNVLRVIALLFWCYVGYLTVFLMTSYTPVLPGYNPPFALFVLDTINLFIHEAGHLFFRIFGMWVYVIGGSFFQVALPAALLVVTARQNLHQIGLPGFWVGENMVNVSVYIRDAPDKHLKLIARGLIHDWNWLLAGNLEAAEPLADIVFMFGILLCIASVATGIGFLLHGYLQDRRHDEPPTASSPGRLARPR
jgi:hypothetical protein